jgi:hypothetical protein
MLKAHGCIGVCMPGVAYVCWPLVDTVQRQGGLLAARLHLPAKVQPLVGVPLLGVLRVQRLLRKRGEAPACGGGSGRGGDGQGVGCTDGDRLQAPCVGFPHSHPHPHPHPDTSTPTHR